MRRKSNLPNLHQYLQEPAAKAKDGDGIEVILLGPIGVLAETSEQRG